jgi:hypothetical protein
MTAAEFKQFCADAPEGGLMVVGKKPDHDLRPEGRIPWRRKT